MYLSRKQFYYIPVETMSTNVNKSERKKNQILYINTYKESRKMVQIDLFAKQKRRHKHREQIYGYQVGKEVGGMNWDIGASIYTLLCIKWLPDENLLHGMASSTQCSMVT